MLHAKARWQIGSADEEVIEQLAGELGVDSLMARLLLLRGVTTKTEGEVYLRGGKSYFYDPMLLDGMQIAVDRIQKAIASGEYIRVYGDYDADGVSSTALMARLLSGLGARYDTYIPHRTREGYGLNLAAIDAAKLAGVGLLITVDTGVSAVEQVAYAQGLGIDVIVTDHHEPPEILPQPFVLINPKKPGCPYPFKGLAGVGVAMKLATALLGRLPEELLDIAAIGTVADLMPLVDENRLIVKLGLERMREQTYPGIKALLAIAGVDRRGVTAGNIGFAIAPRINAGGRLESADEAVQLLITEDPGLADQLAKSLDELNKERQLLVEAITQEAHELVETLRLEGGGELPNVLVLAKEGWNVGVIGIVASKMVDRYYRPAIVLGIDTESGKAKGSARSIAGFDMYKALTHCKELMLHYGGHQAAAGMTLYRDDLTTLAVKLHEIAAEWLKPDDYVPLMKADAVCRLSEVPLSSIERLQQLAPFGMGNPAPKFVFQGLEVKDIRTMGKENQHIKLAISQAMDEVGAALNEGSATLIEAVAFSKGYLRDWITPSAKLDVLGELSVNEWNGTRKPQLVLHDAKVPHMQLYDWRGAHRPQDKTAALSVSLGALVPSCEAQQPAVVCFTGSRDAQLRESVLLTAGESSLWFADMDGTLVAGNEAALASDFGRAKDVVLYSLPPSAEALSAVIRKAASLERCYALFVDPEPDAGNGLPSRDLFKQLYGMMKSFGSWDTANRTMTSQYCKRLNVTEAKAFFMLKVFEELGFVQRNAAVYEPHATPTKKELSESKLYQTRLKRGEVETICVFSTAKDLEQWVRHHQKLNAEPVLTI